MNFCSINLGILILILISFVLIHVSLYSYLSVFIIFFIIILKAFFP